MGRSHVWVCDFSSRLPSEALSQARKTMDKDATVNETE
jgi:hypothetical protein